MRFFITGTAGFIGFHLARRLLDDGHDIVGVDAFTPYYDVALKEARHALLEGRERYRGLRVRLEDWDALARAWDGGPFDVVLHLAAQAGVRYSIENPRAYVDSNFVGTFNLLELCRLQAPGHLLLASTSSAYGTATGRASRETDPADHPLTLYAATKRSSELIAHSYSHLWRVPTTAFRFFTVYGPWGRPDMAPFKFTRRIFDGEPIDIYNHGNMERDFTFIDDLVEAVVRLIDCRPDAAMAGQVAGDSLSPSAPFRTVNIGAGRPTNLLTFIETLERHIGRPAIRRFTDMQQGDVARTWASTDLLHALTGYRPKTKLDAGVEAFVDWYRAYFRP
jgi:UDP-glucuronate 4-epimerase